MSDAATLWTVALQAPLSMGFSRQEYWSGLQCPPPEDLPDPEIEPASLMSPSLAEGFFFIFLNPCPEPPRKPKLRGAGPQFSFMGRVSCLFIFFVCFTLSFIF